MKKHRLFCLALAVLLILLSATASAFAGNKHDESPVKLKPHNFGVRAYEHVAYLSDTLGKRTAGTEVESEAASYIMGEFEKMGLNPTEQAFSYTSRGNNVDSQNVIAVRPAKNSVPGPKTLIVCAHYDSTGQSKGAHDNASGIGVMLEAAERLANTPLDYTIVFAAMGAEEAGYRGANYYVSQMTEADKANTIAVINLDSLIAGDYLYVHGNEGEKGWLRDQIVERANKLGLNIRIQPGLNPDYPAGVGYPASDHVPFERAGMAYVNYESTNWEADQLDEDMTGYIETVSEGAIWHTKKDNLAFLEAAFPGRVQERLEDATTSLTDIFTRMNVPGYDQPNKKVKK